MMFSSDVTKIRIAELKAKGTRGDIQRLRSAIGDALVIVDKTAKLIVDKAFRREHAAALADHLQTAAAHLRAIRFMAAPSSAVESRGDRKEVTKRIARVAHKALNTKGEGAIGEWATALMEIRTAARASLNLPPIPAKGTKGDR